MKTDGGVMIPESNEIRIEVSTKCNYSCLICPREKLTRGMETMDTELFKFVFNKINSETPQYNTLTFPGMGEPLLDETIEDKISYAKMRGFTILILTNGSLLSVERFKRLQDLGVDSIRVSLYGDSPESYNAVHGIKNENMFKTIKKNLTEISEIKKHTKLLLTYNIVDGYNDSDVGSWTEYWSKKVDLLEVWRPHNWVDGKNFRQVEQKKLKTCGRPFKTPLQVQVDGTVNMCCFDFDGKLLLGDLKTQTLQDIFESSMFHKIADCHTSGDYEGSGLICENCDQRNEDTSGVMVYNSKFNINERIHKLSTTYTDLV
jgi:MoaA/NifB/PqqE/SkfB family radical SAM enzyme